MRGESGAPITQLDLSNSSLAYADETRDVTVVDIESEHVVKSLAASGDDRAIFRLSVFGESIVVVYTEGYSTYTAVFSSDRK